MACNLYLLIFWVLFISFNPEAVLTWRNHNRNGIDDPCPPSPHPLGMCKERVAAYGYPCQEYNVWKTLLILNFPFLFSKSRDYTSTESLLLSEIIQANSVGRSRQKMAIFLA
jgi:hypothetical protein